MASFLAEDTLRPFYQMIWDETREELAKRIRGTSYTHSYNPNMKGSDILKGYGEVSKLEGYSASVLQDIRDISHRGIKRDFIDGKVTESSPESVKITVKITFIGETDKEMSGDVIDDLRTLLHYGVSKLENKIKERVATIFADGRVNDRYVIMVKRVCIKASYDFGPDAVPLTVSFRLVIVDEQAICPGGSEYEKAKERYQESEKNIRKC